MGIDSRSRVGGGESGDGQVEWGERGWGSAKGVSWNGERVGIDRRWEGERVGIDRRWEGKRVAEWGGRGRVGIDRGGRGIEWRSGVGGGVGIGELGGGVVEWDGEARLGSWRGRELR